MEKIKCPISYTEVDVSTLKLLKGDGSFAETSKNGLTVSKWACPECGRSIDVEPVSGTIGKARWHNKGKDKGNSGPVKTTPTNKATTGGIVAFSVFLQTVAGALALAKATNNSEQIGQALTDLYRYANKAMRSVLDKKDAIKALTDELNKEKEALAPMNSGFLTLLPFIPEHEADRFKAVFSGKISPPDPDAKAEDPGTVTQTQ